MRCFLPILLCLALSAAVSAADLGPRSGAKPATVQTAPLPDPDVIRQGGDTIADAVVITQPILLSGTTVGYTDDYDEVCPYSGSTSPDVVYSLTPGASCALTLDMIGSSYDTKLYVYDAELNLIACNDDYYPDYVSRLELVPFEAGVEHFIVVDGYGGDAGEYQLIIDEGWCPIECPPGGQVEGEPFMDTGYVDTYNSGCGAPGGEPVLQSITSGIFCGVSGWYDDGTGAIQRDSDWLLLEIPAGGAVELEADAELPLAVYELGPQDCNSVGVLQSMTVGPCMPMSMVITGTPGDTVWLWAGPPGFDGPVFQFDYIMLMDGVVATEPHSWSVVKSMFH